MDNGSQGAPRARGSQGKVITIDGEVDPAALGITLPHEHLFVNSTSWFVEPATQEGWEFAESEISLQNLTGLRYHPFGHRSNIRIDHVPTVVEEVKAFQAVGGRTIVDLTPAAIGRDVAKLREVQAATGVQIVAGSGYYVAHSHPERVAQMTVDDIATEILADLLEGIDDTGVRAGVIGEIGSSRPLHTDEVKVLEAVAAVQQQTGAPVSLHMSHPEDYAHSVLDILEKGGADLNKVVVGHQDGQTPFPVDYHASIAERGAYVEYDLFGVLEFSEDGLWDPPPADIDRVEALRVLCERGWASRLLVSHDVCTKLQQRAYGGFGFAHLPGHVARVMCSRGLSDEETDQIMVRNPANWLTWTKSTGAEGTGGEEQ